MKTHLITLALLGCIHLASAQQQTINLGTTANDGTGDSLRTAFGKVNANDAALFSALSGKSDTSHTHSFSSLTSKPTTLTGYGITDAIAATGNISGTSGINIDIATQLNQLAPLSAPTFVNGVTLADTGLFFTGDNGTATLSVNPAMAADVTLLLPATAGTLVHSDDVLTIIDDSVGDTIQGHSGALDQITEGTWTGATSITTLGTVTSGTWNATAIADAKIASALTGKTYNGLSITANASATLSVAAFKSFTVAHTITLDGTDGSTLNIGGGGTLAASAFTDTTSASNISTGSLALARIAQGGATSGQALSWNGTAWAPATVSSGLTVGTTSVGSSTDGYVLYNNAGTLGNLAVTGTGNVVRATSPTMGAVTLTGAIDATAATGQNIFGGGIQTRQFFILYDGSGSWFYVANDGPGKGIYVGSNCFIGFGNTTNDAGSTKDTFLSRLGAANFMFGKTSATPADYTLSGNAASGTNVAGGKVTFEGGNGTGTGGSGKIIFRTAPSGSSGSTANTLATRAEIDKDGVLLLKECSTVPSGSPTAGFYLYVDPADHALKAKGASGTVTTLASP